MYRDQSVAVVMPVHNEQNHVERAVDRVPAFVDLIVVVDDGSSDDTWRALSRITDTRVVKLRHDRNLGVGAATKTGYRYCLNAGADLVAVMDGDGQMDGRDLFRLLDRALSGVDYVKGNRFLDSASIRCMPRLRYVGNRFFSWLARHAAAFNDRLDSHCGYTVITRQALSRLPLADLYDRYGFPTEMFFAARRAGLMVQSVPVRTVYGDEVSGINPFTAVPAILFLIARSYVHRRYSALKHTERPTVLLLTSSFPSSLHDETCGYIRDFARGLSSEFAVEILAPADRSADRCPEDTFTLHRSRSLGPVRFNPLQAGDDLNHLASADPLTKLAALVSLVCFFFHALALAIRADVVCSHWMVPSGLVGALIARLLGKPHVVVEHSGALHLLSGIRGGKRITRFIVKRSDQIVTVSADLNRMLIALCPVAQPKSVVIPMGVSVLAPSKTPSRAKTRTILFIGRLVDIKGVDVLLRSMRGLGEARLIIAGDGECRENLERLAQALSVNAQFVGRIDATQRAALLEACDAVVIPSRLADGRAEGMPVVCLEAMAAGRAVIASRSGGLAEAIIDGENGLLFEPGDHRALNDALSRVLSDENLRRKIEKNARGSAAAYAWPRIASRYIAVINSALRKDDAIGARRIEASSING